MDAGTPLDFYRQGTRGAFVACAAVADRWQAVSIACPGCGARYIAAVARRHRIDDAATVAAYPDIAGQSLTATHHLAAECPDHGFRVRVGAFSVVG